MKNILLVTLLLSSLSSFAKLSVFTTTTNLADIVKQIGGDKIEVTSFCKGVQDPHFLEAKPSYTVKLSRADLLVSVGGGLEVGWLPLVVRGSRNPKVRIGQRARLVAADFVHMLHEEKEEISRAMGDVHPEGNPHFMVSPVESVKVAKAVSDKLSELDSENKKIYETNFKKFESSISKFLNDHKLKGNNKVISYHKTLTYFYRDFNIENVDVLEPKPGIPPTASHIIKLIKKIKAQKIKKIIIENYFDDVVAKRIKKEVPDVEITTVAVAVDGKDGIGNIFDLYNHLIKAVR